MQHDAVPSEAGRPLVDPALLLEALTRLRAANRVTRPGIADAGSAVNLAIDPALRPAVPAPRVRTIAGARAGAPVLIPAGLARLLKSGYSAQVEQAPADRSIAEPNHVPSRPT